jgi:hypothetical protein
MSNNEYKKLVIRLIKDNRVSEEEALILINNINNECKSDTHVIQTEKPLVTDNEELNKLLNDYGEYPKSPFVYKKEERKFPSDITVTYTEKNKKTYPFSDSEYRISDYPFSEPVTCTSTSNIGYKTEE